MDSERMVLERTARHGSVQSNSRSGIKTVLLHIQNDATYKERVDTALSLARASSAHLTCLHVTPIQAYVAFDTFGGVFVMQDVMRAIDEEESRLRAMIEEELGREDVTWDYIQTTGNVPTEVVRYSALADVVVTSRSPHRSDFAGPATGLLGEILTRARTPLLIPGDGPTAFSPNGPALIAWDGSFEAASAVRASLGLLKTTSAVRVLQVEEGKTGFDWPGTGMLEFLSRHGIHAELVSHPAVEGRDAQYVASSIISQGKEIGASYIVMGGYSHTRIGEYLFGGVTRTMLSGCPVALVIAQ